MQSGITEFRKIKLPIPATEVQDTTIHSLSKESPARDSLTFMDDLGFIDRYTNA